MSPEPIGNRTLTAAEVRSEAVALLDGLLDEAEVSGYRVSREMLLDTLTYAAAEQTSLHGACTLLDGLADDTTLRDHLNGLFPPASTFDLNRRFKSVLLESVPKSVFKRRRRLALDLKDFPYYGHSPALEPWICRGRARDGTTRFLRIATAYVMHHSQRVTLAAMLVSSGMSHGEIIRDLVGHLRFAGVKIASLYLDRGFASVEVIRTIERLRMPAVIACPLWGTATSGVRQYCCGRRSRTVQHTFRSAKYGTACATLAVARSRTGGRRTKKRARWFVYILIGKQPKPLKVHRAYRDRFGVETSYRVLNQIRPRTTSRNPAIRLLLVMIGILLSNLWVRLKRLAGRQILPPWGFRRVPVAVFDDAPLRLIRLKILLRYAIEQRYGLQFTVPLPIS